MTGSIWKAFVAPFKGLKLIVSDRKLFALSVTPILVDLVLLVIMLVVLFFKLDNIVYAIVGRPETTVSWVLAILLFVLFGILSVGLGALIFVLLGTILASPFLDAISARTEKLLTKTKSDESGGIAQTMKDIIRSIKDAVKKLLAIIAIQLILLPLNLIPIIGNVVYAVLSAFVSFIFVGWEFLDFPWDRWRWTFKDKRGFIKQKIIPVAALGCATSILLIIPFINLALMPAAACGATTWAIAERRSKGGEKA